MTDIHKNLKPPFSTRVLFHIAIVVIGLVVGFLFSMFTSGTLQTEMTVGFPVPWAVWANENGDVIDYVSPLSVFLWGIDVLSGVGLVYLLAAGVWLLRKRNSRSRTA